MQARLDWQMWFAALGEYRRNPWLIHLAYKLLLGTPEVKALLDRGRDPFPTAPPSHVRMRIVDMDYAPVVPIVAVSDGTCCDWKRRCRVVLALPAY